jgi:trk system potassium uptake protein TrkH
MNISTVLSILGYLMLILALFLIAPLVVALVYDSNSPFEIQEISAFSITLAVCLLAGILLNYKFRGGARQVGQREGFAIVSFSWLSAVLVGMLPFLLSGVLTSVTDAFFETMSGFTTTGATVFGGRPNIEIEDIPHGLQFWRCMTQWLGGMGIVVLSVALLSFLGMGGYRLLKAETPGGIAFERDKPRITDAAKDLWILYLLISAAEFILLKISGLSVFDSFCHTFTTMSTGGFSPHTESIAAFGPVTQWIIIVFMFIAGVNFSLHAQVFRGRFKIMYKNPEFRLYFIIIIGAIIIGLIANSSLSGFEQNFRETTFQVISIGTTTGYVTADFDAWPQIMRLTLVLLMFVGGCMGSTGGGMKVARLLLYIKTISRELHRLIYPRAVRPLRVGEKVIDDKLVLNILAFGSIFAGCFILGTTVMSINGYDLDTAASASIAALGNIGPGLGQVGPEANWAHLHPVTKWIMSFLMLMGRLELFSVLILFTPWCWKK